MAEFIDRLRGTRDAYSEPINPKGYKEYHSNPVSRGVSKVATNVSSTFRNSAQARQEWRMNQERQRAETINAEYKKMQYRQSLAKKEKALRERRQPNQPETLARYMFRGISGF